VKLTALAVIAGVLLSLTACQAAAGSTTPAATVAVVTSGCHAGTDAGQPLPDPHCTPGATNPAVTPATIHATICVSGWTATVRPPQSYTEPLKRSGIHQYGYTDTRLSSYEEDHLVSLELGGSPRDPRNLWPEPGRSPNVKDRVESAAHSAVCSGRLPLAAAQAGIAADWVTLGRQLGVKIP